MRDLRPQTAPAARRSGGFSLIELLVAVLVMGIGVLGVTALQMVSLQNNRMALDRDEAVQLAYDIMDRVRVNPGADYSIAIGDAPPAAPDCIGVGSNCSETAMRDFDLASWKCLLGAYQDDAVCDGLRADGVVPAADAQPGLPQGDGSVAVNNPSPGVSLVTVTVQWTGVDGDNQTVVIDSQ